MNFNARSNRAAAIISALTLAFVAMSVPTRAQSETPAPPPPGGDVFYERVGPGPVVTAGAIGFVGFEAGLGGKTVTGAPFTATISTQTTQTLADGNTIQRSTTGTIARDSQGRTRRETTLPAIGPFAASGEAPPHMVEIYDAVAGVHYILDSNRKVAHKMERHLHAGRMNLTRSLDAGPMAMRVVPDGESHVTSVSLGTQTINGVTADGTRETRTIPAGEIGNAKPISIVTERWYSPDLQMVVMSKRTDPMGGDSVTQLTDVQRGDPDPALFQVPSDYTVKEGGPAVMIQRSKGKAPLAIEPDQVQVPDGQVQGQVPDGGPEPPPPPDEGPETVPAPPQN